MIDSMLEASNIYRSPFFHFCFLPSPLFPLGTANVFRATAVPKSITRTSFLFFCHIIGWLGLALRFGRILGFAWDYVNFIIVILGLGSLVHRVVGFVGFFEFFGFVGFVGFFWVCSYSFAWSITIFCIDSYWFGFMSKGCAIFCGFLLFCYCLVFYNLLLSWFWVLALNCFFFDVFLVWLVFWVCWVFLGLLGLLSSLGLLGFFGLNEFIGFFWFLGIL